MYADTAAASLDVPVSDKLCAVFNAVHDVITKEGKPLRLVDQADDISLVSVGQMVAVSNKDGSRELGVQSKLDVGCFVRMDANGIITPMGQCSMESVRKNLEVYQACLKL